MDARSSPAPPRRGHVRSLSGTLEEINQSAALDVERLPQIRDPHTGMSWLVCECKRFVSWAKTQSWLPTAVVFLGVTLLIAVPSVSLLRSGDDASRRAWTNGTETNGTDTDGAYARRALLETHRKHGAHTAFGAFGYAGDTEVRS